MKFKVLIILNSHENVSGLDFTVASIMVHGNGVVTGQLQARGKFHNFATSAVSYFLRRTASGNEDGIAVCDRDSTVVFRLLGLYTKAAKPAILFVAVPSTVFIMISGKVVPALLLPRLPIEYDMIYNVI